MAPLDWIIGDLGNGHLFSEVWPCSISHIHLSKQGDAYHPLGDQESC